MSSPGITVPPRVGRVVIEGVSPQIDGGRFPAKRVVGEQVEVTADVFADGHDTVLAVVRHRPPGRRWAEVWLRSLGNDRWTATFPVTALGLHRFTIQAWVDPFRTWLAGTLAKIEAGQEVAVELAVGAALVEAAAEASPAKTADRLRELARPLEASDLAGFGQACEPLLALMDRRAGRSAATTHPELAVLVERERARFGSWYEMFPRSTAPARGTHGTFADVARRLPEVAAMGFDVLYLPPIHPIGRTATARARTTPLDGPPRRSGQPVGHRGGRGRSHRGPPRAGHRGRLPGPRRRGGARTTSRSRSTSRSSARPITRG